MRTLWMICDKTLKAKIQRLRWLGYVKKMNEERGPVKAQQLQLIDSKKGRPKKGLKEVLARDTNIRGLTQLQ